MIPFGHDAHLIDGRPGLLRLDEFPQATDRNYAPVHLPLPDGPPLIDQQITPGSLVFVCGQFRAPGKQLGLVAPGLHGLKEGDPGFVQLNEYLIADLAGKRLIGGVAFDLVIDRHVVQVDSLVDEGLAHEVVGGIPEVFGLESRLINLAITWITARNHMLFHDLHAAHPRASRDIREGVRRRSSSLGSPAQEWHMSYLLLIASHSSGKTRKCVLLGNMTTDVI